jgi:hypothetical protein
MRVNDMNRRKALADVVSIEAWHESLSAKTAAVPLYADIVFNNARIGGEKESKVRFRLRIKRAELVVIIPETKPFARDRRSVARMVDKVTVTRSSEETIEDLRRVEGGARKGVKSIHVGAEMKGGQLGR